MVKRAEIHFLLHDCSWEGLAVPFVDLPSPNGCFLPLLRSTLHHRLKPLFEGLRKRLNQLLVIIKALLGAPARSPLIGQT